MTALEQAAQPVHRSTAPAPQQSGRDRGGPGEPCVLLKLGEVVLKGKNRDSFERRLQNHIRMAVRELGIETTVSRREGVIVLRVPGGDLESVDKVAQRATDVMGIARVHRAWRVPKEPEAAVSAAIDLVGRHPDL